MVTTIFIFGFLWNLLIAIGGDPDHQKNRSVPHDWTLIYAIFSPNNGPIFGGNMIWPGLWISHRKLDFLAG